MKPARFIVCWAQNATPVHKGFLASLQTYSAEHNAMIVAVAGRYKNPTSRWSKADEDDQWYADEIAPYLTEKRQQLCPNLVLLGDVSVQPTASRPLTGFETFVGKSSAILGHPKRALETVATATRMPRILATTGAVTVANYTPSKAGKKGDHHHVLGALIVEIDAKGFYWLRHVSADKTGAFYDLNKRYTPAGVEKAGDALALVLGDFHRGKEDWAVIRATRALCRLLRPDNLALHDFLDFAVRNHHDRGLRTKHEKSDQLVRDEVEGTARALTRITQRWGAKRVRVVRSNHDEAFERWLEDTKPYEDPANAPYYHAVWSRAFEHYADHGEWPNLFEMEARRLGVPAGVHFLRRNESLKVKDVEVGYHGDKGIGGSRGSPMQYAKLGAKVITGHTHSPKITDGAYTVGVTAKLDHGYNLLPSAWANAHCVVYPDGKRALIFIVNGQYRAQEAA